MKWIKCKHHAVLMAEIVCPTTSRFVECMMFVQREKCPSPPGSAVEKDGLGAVPSVADGLDGQHHVQHDPGVDVIGGSGRTSLYAGAYESRIHMGTR